MWIIQLRWQRTLTFTAVYTGTSTLFNKRNPFSVADSWRPLDRSDLVLVRCSRRASVSGSSGQGFPIVTLPKIGSYIQLNFTRPLLLQMSSTCRLILLVPTLKGHERPSGTRNGTRNKLYPKRILSVCACSICSGTLGSGKFWRSNSFQLSGKTPRRITLYPVPVSRTT